MTSDWSSWSACSKSCGGGSQTRTRTITKPASNGGKDCGSLVETQSCNSIACPTDCVTSDWSTWSACSKSCGGGTQTRTRTVTKPAANGGKDCGSLTETQPCNTQACITPGAVVSSNGRCGPDNGETRCSDGQCCSIHGWCGSGLDHCVNAKRSDTTYDGKNAPTAASLATINCEVSPWTSWGTCSKTCGGGQQTRTRTITKQPANGGTSCPTLSESQSCNTQVCPTATTTSSCDTTACSRVINDYLARGWWYTSTDFGECKGCPTVSYPNKLPTTSSCDTTACSRVINDYLARGWWYTSTDFGECKGCPTVSYPNKLS